MENAEQFMSIIKEDMLSLDTFKLSCIFKDICLKNYKYKPRLSDCNQIIHEWTHTFKDKTLTVDIIRQILVQGVYELFVNLQCEYLSESQEYEPNDEKHYGFQRNIKKVAEICIMLDKGLLFKEFVDNYRNGYFN